MFYVFAPQEWWSAMPWCQIAQTFTVLRLDQTRLGGYQATKNTQPCGGDIRQCEVHRVAILWELCWELCQKGYHHHHHHHLLLLLLLLLSVEILLLPLPLPLPLPPLPLHDCNIETRYDQSSIEGRGVAITAKPIGAQPKTIPETIPGGRSVQGAIRARPMGAHL